MLREPFDAPITTAWVSHGLFDVDRNAGNGEEIASPDRDLDGYLSDDERDEDADGLSNYDELHGRMLVGYWNSCYKAEKPFHIVYAGVSPTDADTDGDGVRDGADDQDHDDVPNIMELSRNMATGRSFDDPKTDKNLGDPTPDFGRVNPFNPCEPDIHSRTCPRYQPLGATAWAPFDSAANGGDDPDYLVLN
jgi:hypothetical protein